MCRQSCFHVRRQGIKRQAWLYQHTHTGIKSRLLRTRTASLILCISVLSAFRADWLRRKLTFYTQTVCAEKSGAKVLLTYWFRWVDSMGENSEPALNLQITVWEFLSALLSSSVGGIWSPTACPQLPDTSPYVVMLIPLTSPTTCWRTAFKLCNHMSLILLNYCNTAQI